MLLSAKWVITPTKLCVCLRVCARVHTLVFAPTALALSQTLCVCVDVQACFHYELICRIDEGIWCFHMGLSCLIPLPLVDAARCVFFVVFLPPVVVFLRSR